MKNYINEIYNEKEHDGFIFILDADELFEVSAFSYLKKQKPIEEHPDLGFKYHVILYRETFDGRIIEPEMFEAVIGNPAHYVANLIKSGFFGTLCKKTKKSKKIANDMFKDLVRVSKEDAKFEP